jgi:hypothetical protein
MMLHVASSMMCVPGGLQDLTEGPWRQSNLDAGASRVIAVPEPLGGALVVGESVIAYMGQGQAMKCTPIKPTIIRVRFCSGAS